MKPLEKIIDLYLVNPQYSEESFAVAWNPRGERRTGVNMTYYTLHMVSEHGPIYKLRPQYIKFYEYLQRLEGEQDVGRPLRFNVLKVTDN
jgi:hypothetical protein